jgi:hypothetical protein
MEETWRRESEKAKRGILVNVAVFVYCVLLFEAAMATMNAVVNNR